MENVYRADKFKEEFKSSKIFKQLKRDYDELIFDKHFPLAKQIIRPTFFPTPRQQYAQPRTNPSCFSVVPFFYLKFLTELEPEAIYDLGCGWNIFKKYIPDIIGIGAENENDPSLNADIRDFVDDCFIAGHQEYFNSVFSINALHFIPLSQLRKRVLDFHSMIAPGGRGWLALNAKRMFELDPEFNHLSFNDDNVQLKNTVLNFIHAQLKNLPDKILLLDIDLDCIDNYMDGNIHIIFEKPKDSI